VEAGSRLRGALGHERIVETALADVFAVVHVHAQPVSQSVGHEEVHGARGDSVVGRTFEHAHADEPTADALSVRSFVR